ncbi:OmpH family outer membrane protein [Marinobacter bryozoorum]|jgi:outer membrane protein|uniref:OmpH family outer membrane protein n=1 Tax=Marinobacter bryozoorum TaxID=256324 RepID=UPI00200510B7|nr:OmpH family outer membrane protein [Marinobacter bryozoorum]MCK7544482.1 OmpH family outer membrane protein [Marinobacter bryozoorum]
MTGFRELVKHAAGVRVVMAAAALAMTMPALAETRIGVVDLRQALFSSDDAQVFSDQLEEEFSGTEAQVREAQQEARQLQERLQKDGAMMNESERQQLTAEFQQKAQAFARQKQQLDQTLNSRKQAFLEEARPEVDAAVKALMEEHGLDIILPSEAVVSVKPELNLTDELLEKLNQ